LGNVDKLEIGGLMMKNLPVLTPEESKAIKWVLRQIQYKDHPSVFVEEHMKNNMDGWIGEAKALNGLHIDALIRALYIGYEIEKPKFEVGDIVVGLTTGFIYKLTHTCGRDFYATKLSNGEKSLYVDVDVIRHATKEESFWTELGREVGEFVEGDVVIENDNMTHLIGEYKEELADDLEFAKNYYTKKLLKGFYPVEAFVKFPQ
jgi:hypothetical protein